MSANGGESAYPVTVHDRNWNPVREGHGLTKRELIAAMALQGYLARTLDNMPEIAAFHAVKHADALLAALAEPQT